MKKLSFVFLTVFVLVSACSLLSCDSKMSKLKAEIEQTAQGLPMEMGGGIVFESLKFDEESKEVIADLNMGDIPMDANTLNKNKQLIKESIKCQLSMDDDFSKLIGECADADVALTFNYKLGAGTVKVTMTPEDVKSTASMNIKQACDAYFDSQIKLTKTMLPMQVDAATVYTDFDRNDNYLIYTYTIDESQVPISLLRENGEILETVRESLRNEFSANAAVRYLVSICKKGNMGIIYRYIGNTTGETLDIKFESGDL